MSYPYYDGMPPHVDVDTSVEAAETVKPKTAAQRERIASYIRGCGKMGATMKEIEHALNMLHQSVCPRFRELEKDGVLYRTTTKRGGSRVYVFRQSTWSLTLRSKEGGLDPNLKK